MLPFLLLSHRPEDEAAHAEHHSFRRIMGLRSEELVQVRMNLEQPELDFADYSFTRLCRVLMFCFTAASRICV